MARRAAVVVTAVDRLPDGRRSGYWLAEVAHPWLALADAGWDVVPLSTQDGAPEPGGFDMTDPVQRRFRREYDDLTTAHRVVRRPEFYLPADFEVVVYAGGCGALFDLPDDGGLAGFTSAVLSADGVVAACGFGVGGLLGLTAAGRPVVEGRTVTGPTDDEVELLGLMTCVPFLPDRELLARGARTVHAASFAPFVVVDGPLITGQNPASAPELAARLLNATTAL